MKLSEYLPETPALSQQMTDLNAQIGMFQLIRGYAIKWRIDNSL